jgi:hypothetical protein
MPVSVIEKQQMEKTAKKGWKEKSSGEFQITIKIIEICP